jgi:hypothetical protein
MSRKSKNLRKSRNPRKGEGENEDDGVRAMVRVLTLIFLF